MPLADGTPLIASDGALMLDADGSVRLADGVSDACCCGCPEGCYGPCGDCCLSPTSKLRVTVDIVRCQYDTRDPNLADCETDPPQFMGCIRIEDDLPLSGITEEYEGDPDTPSAQWGRYDLYTTASVASRDYTDTPPATCEFLDDLSGSVVKKLSLSWHCKTGHWRMNYGPWTFGEDVSFVQDLGEGDCTGISMAEFIYVDGLGCPTEMGGHLYVVFKVRVTAEVIDNEDCMAV